MESKILHGESSTVEKELNYFLRASDISIKNIEMSTCTHGGSFARTIVTVLIVYERS